MRSAIHPEADAEFAAAVSYYSGIRPELGIRFYNEIETLIRKVTANPSRYFQFRPPVRRIRWRRFPYSVAYLEQLDRVWIVAIMHAKRHPDYWKERTA